MSMTGSTAFLLVKIDNHSPIPASEVAGIIRALDCAYQEISGTGLTLAEVRPGSTLITLTQQIWPYVKGAADIFSTGKSLAEFVRLLRACFKKNKSTDAEALPKLLKAAKALAKVAKKNQCLITLESGEERLTIHPLDHTNLGLQSKARARQTLPLAVPALKEIEVNRELKQTLLRLPRTSLSQGDPMLLAVLAEALVKAGGREALNEVIDFLETENRHDLATLVRTLSKS